MNRVSSTSAVIAVAIGAAGLAGWILSAPALMSVLPGFVSMKANTAVALVLAGIALLLRVSRPAAGARAAFVCTLLVAVLGAVSLAQYVFGWQLGIDELLFEDSDPSPWTVWPGRMAASTAVAFLLIGIALALLEWEPRPGVRPAEWLAAGAFAIALIASVEYAFDRPIVYPYFQSSRMALHTIAALLALAIGVIAARADLGLVGALRRGMASALETWIYGALLLSVIALAAAGAASYLSAQESSANAEQVEHTHQVRLALRELLSMHQDIETGSRGFAITGSEEFLEPYERALESEEAKFGELIALVRDNPAQSQRLDWLAPLLQERLEEARAIVRMRRDGEPDAAVERIAGGEGRRLMDSIRATIDGLDAEEARLLGVRQEQDRAGARRLRAIILGSAGFAMLVAGFAIVVVHRDFERRHRAEQALRRLNDTLERRVLERTARLTESEQRFRVLVEASPQVILLVNSDGRIAFANAQVEKTFGHAPAELVGRGVETLIPERYHAAHAPLRGEFMKAPTARAMGAGRELFGLHRDGTEVPVEIGLSPIQTDEGSFVLASIIDITERKRSENELLALKEDLERRVIERTAALESAGRELAEKNQQLEHADHMKSQFLANMSHELRTPLNAIIGFSDLIASGLVGPLNDRQREFAGDILSSGNHLLALIDDILDLSKVEAGALHLDLEPVDPIALLTSCLGIVKEKAQSRRIALRFEPGADLGGMQADSRKFKQIVFNLLSNAIKFTDPGGEVKLAARRVARAGVETTAETAQRAIRPAARDDADYLEISVVDTGIGIAADRIDDLFKPFVQVDASLARRHEGTGLGLALMKRLVELSGGGIGVWSTLGQGSKFSVWLPFLAAERPGAVAPARTDSRLALVIEDGDADAARLQRDLESIGFTVERARTTEEGIRRARARRPDVITLDIFLPEIDGWECLARLKADAALADIPVVIVSVASGLQRGIALGAAHVLQKPIRADDLQHVLTKLGLRPVPPARPHALVVDDDPAAIEIVAARLEAAGFEVQCASGGREAIEAARARPPRLMVLDLMMPEVSGFEVVEALRNGSTSAIPIVITTAKSLTPEDRARLNGQVCAVMQKGGLSSDAFIAEVRRALAGGSG